MAGNTRGKLKEHLEGIHRNFDWILRHIEISLALITVQVKEQHAAQGIALSEEELKAKVEEHYLYKGFNALATGVHPMDDLAHAVYDSL